MSGIGGGGNRETEQSVNEIPACFIYLLFIYSLKKLVYKLFDLSFVSCSGYFLLKYFSSFAVFNNVINSY